MTASSPALSAARRKALRPVVRHMRWLVREYGATPHQAALIASKMEPGHSGAAFFGYLDGLMPIRRRSGLDYPWSSVRPCADPDRNGNYADNPAYVDWKLKSDAPEELGFALLWRKLNAARAERADQAVQCGS